MLFSVQIWGESYGAIRTSCKTSFFNLFYSIAFIRGKANRGKIKGDTSRGTLEKVSFQRLS